MFFFSFDVLHGKNRDPLFMSSYLPTAYFSFYISYPLSYSPLSSPHLSDSNGTIYGNAKIHILITDYVTKYRN